MIKNYFKTAWRNLTKNKTHSFINIAGLTIGLTCCLLIALYIQHELSFDKFEEKGTVLLVLLCNTTSTEAMNRMKATIPV